MSNCTLFGNKLVTHNFFSTFPVRPCHNIALLLPSWTNVMFLIILFYSFPAFWLSSFRLIHWLTSFGLIHWLISFRFLSFILQIPLPQITVPLFQTQPPLLFTISPFTWTPPLSWSLYLSSSRTSRVWFCVRKHPSAWERTPSASSFIAWVSVWWECVGAWHCSVNSCHLGLAGRELTHTQTWWRFVLSVCLTTVCPVCLCLFLFLRACLYVVRVCFFFSYEEKLARLNLFSLEKRRLRGKLTECFKILKGFTNMDANRLFLIDDSSRTRSNRIKLRCKHLHVDCTNFFFTNDVVREWNKLPPSVVQCNTINSFKNKLDRHLLQQGLR